MENRNTNYSQKLPRILFVGHDRKLGKVSLAQKYATRENLERIFQISQIIIIDSEGNEIFFEKETGLLKNLSEDEVYCVLDEKTLEEFPDEESGDSTKEKIRYSSPIKQTVNELSKRYEKMEESRKEIINKYYVPLHPHIYNFKEEFLEPKYLEAIKSNSTEKILSLLTPVQKPWLYSLRIFTLSFCRSLLEEVINFENSGLPIVAPNSMNNYGVILDQIGFTDFFQKYISEYFKPLSGLLFPLNGGSTLDSHHAFIVQYKLGEDLNLGFHVDDSEVTLNLCLGREGFQGGNLYFIGIYDLPETHKDYIEFSHIPGTALIHLGKHRHGAKDLKSGERFNLIVWCRSSKYRISQHHQCSCCHEQKYEHNEQ